MVEIAKVILESSLLTYLTLGWVILIPLILFLMIAAKSRKQRRLWKKNTEELTSLKKVQTTLNRGLHRLKSMLDESGNTIEKINQTLNNRVYPLMQKETVIKSLQEQVSKLEKEKEGQKRLTVELAKNIDNLTRKLKEESEEKERLKERLSSRESGEISAKVQP